MGYETTPVYQEFSHDKSRQVFEAESQSIQKLTEAESPATVLGNIVLGAVIGGALGAGSAMPRTEAITLELIAGTSQVAGDIKYY